MTYLPRDKRLITFELVGGDQELPDLKRPKSSSSVDKWSLDEEFSVLFSEYNPLNHPRPLGLNLKKSPILEELVEATLAQANKFNTVPTIENLQPADPTNKDVKTRASRRTSRPIDLKASNFPAVLLKIGKWEYVPKHEGDLVAKCYFAKQKLVWEILDGGLKSKIEMQWSDIVGLHANYPDHGPGTLTVVLGKQPLFFRETNPQPRKHTIWNATCDFTNGEASKYKEHCLQCAPGILNKHYEKLIKYDTRLKHLSQQQHTELNLQFTTKGPNMISQVKTPSLSQNMSISNILNHIGHHVSGKKPAPVLPFSENVMVGVNQDNMLKNINSNILNHIGHHVSGKKPAPVLPFSENVTVGVNQANMLKNINSDEEIIMSEINSLCSLLHDENEYPNHDIEMNQNQVNGWDEVNDYSTLESPWDCSPIPMHELDNKTFCMSW